MQAYSIILRDLLLFKNNKLTHEVSECGLVMSHQVVNNGSPAGKEEILQASASFKFVINGGL